MSNTTIRSGGKDYCFYSIDGASWRDPYNNQIITGRGNDGSGMRLYRCYFALNLSSLDKSRDLLDSAALHLTNTTDFSATAKISVGIRTSKPSAAFSTSDFDEDLTPSGGYSTIQGETTLTVSKSKLQNYLGRTIYICICRYDSNDNYAEFGAQKNVNDPYIYLEYTEATSTMTASGNTIGSTVTFTINSNSPSFTHTITYTAGGSSGTVVSKTSLTSVPWTPPMSLCAENTSGTTVACTLTLKTYSGSTLVGTSTLSVSLKIPSSVKPVINDGAFTLSPKSNNATVNGWGEYLAGYSYVRAVWDKTKIDLTGAGGATVSSYKMTINGADYPCTGSTPTGNSVVINSKGTYTVTLTVTDTRGRTAKKTGSVTFLAYTSPYISSHECIRARPVGGAYQEEEGGPSLGLQAKLKITSVNSNNSGSIKVEYKLASSNSWTLVSNSWPSSSSTKTYSDINMSAGSTYNVRITPKDAIMTSGGTILTVTLPAKSDDVVIQKTNSGLRVGIGKAPEATGVEVVGDIIAYDTDGIKRAEILDDGIVRVRNASDNTVITMSQQYGLSVYDGVGTEDANRVFRVSPNGASPSPLPIDQGGTHATSEKNARSNLGIPMEFKRLTSISAGNSATYTITDSARFMLVSVGAASGNNSPKGMWIGNTNSTGTVTLGEIFNSSTNLSVSTGTGTLTITNSTSYTAYIYIFIFNDGGVS